MNFYYYDGHQLHQQQQLLGGNQRYALVLFTDSVALDFVDECRSREKIYTAGRNYCRFISFLMPRSEFQSTTESSC